MALEELQKQLYKEKPEFEKRAEVSKTFEPGHQAQPPQGPSPQWQRERKGFFSGINWGKALKIFLICLAVFLVGVGGFLVWRAFSGFDSSKVFISLFGPERIVSGDEVIFTLRYGNNTKTKLEDVKLTFTYPEGAVPVDKKGLSQIGNSPVSTIQIGELAPGDDKQMSLQAYVSGLKGDKKNASAKIEYHPTGVSTVFQNTAEFQGEIFSVPLVLNFDLPEKVVSGQSLNFALNYLNTSESNFSNLTLQIEYPSGFTLSSASPVPSQGQNTWQLPEISANEEGKILISGVLSGVKDEIKTFRAKIGVGQDQDMKLISESMASSLVSASPLSVQLTVNDSRDYIANVGDQLNYKISYQNTTDVPINSAYIILKFDTKILDFSSLKIEKGFFNSLNNTITWNESSLSDLSLLQPGQQGDIGFTLGVKNQLPSSSFADKNFIIGASAKIDSSDVPASLSGTQLSGSDSLATKLNSKLFIKSSGFYYDSNMPNSGPLPPKVGQETTYTIYWQVANLANDVDNVTVESYLPSYITWLNHYQPSDADVKYESNTGKLSWTIGKLSANSPARQMIFQIGLVPAINQVGQTPELVKTTTISGKDLFTDVNLHSEAASLRTNLPDDNRVGYERGSVTQ